MYGNQVDYERDLACDVLERVEVHSALKVASMDAWTPVPMDSDTIAFMNGLAAKDKPPISGELEFKVGKKTVVVGEEAAETTEELQRMYGRRERAIVPSCDGDYDPTIPESDAVQAVEFDDGMPSYRSAEPAPVTAEEAISSATELPTDEDIADVAIGSGHLILCRSFLTVTMMRERSTRMQKLLAVMTVLLLSLDLVCKICDHVDIMGTSMGPGHRECMRRACISQSRKR
jgi:hypothetical protein